MGMQHPGHTHGTDSPAKEPPGFHGWVVVGTDSIFLSHLPMFHPTHGRQVILHASLGRMRAPTGRTARPTLTPRSTPSHPKLSFSATWCVPAGDKDRLTSFAGSLIRNHFEEPEAHPGKPEEIASNVDVEVLDVVHHHKLEANGVRPDKLGYVLFGKGDERFLAHLIHRKPDFDQLISVSVAGAAPTDDQLLEGIDVTRRAARRPEEADQGR